ncbi:MAG: biopolymer transporter ExbD [Bacteroidota bacterium]
MPLLNRRTTRDVEIPTASMADIAFLLLIFFLLVTTINTEKGIYMQLPPKLDETVEPPEIKDRNLLVILVSNDGNVLVEGEFMRLENIREEVVRHITNDGSDPGYSENPEKAVVSFKTERALPYERYVEVLDEIKGAYVDTWNDYARSEFGVRDYPTYQASLPDDDPNTPEDEGEDLVKDRFPLKLSLAEPDPG